MFPNTLFVRYHYSMVEPLTVRFFCTIFHCCLFVFVFWVALIAQALHGFLNAAATVTFRLPKAAPWIDALTVEVSTRPLL